jgi:hypothetical protein
MDDLADAAKQEFDNAQDAFEDAQQDVAEAVEGIEDAWDQGDEAIEEAVEERRLAMVLAGFGGVQLAMIVGLVLYGLLGMRRPQEQQQGGNFAGRRRPARAAQGFKPRSLGKHTCLRRRPRRASRL